MRAPQNHTTRAGGHRDGFWFDVTMLLLGVLVACGTWWEITHHGGVIPVVVPAAVMLVFVARRARRAKHGTRR